MAPPPAITYGPTVTALLNSEATIQRQQYEVLRQPLAGLEEGSTYSLSEAFPLLPAGTLRSAATLFAKAPNMTFSYRLATVNGETVPQFSFLQDKPAPVPYKNGTYLSEIKPSFGEPTPTNSFTANLGGVAIIIGANKAMSEGGVPNEMIGPILGGSYAMADVTSNFFFKSATSTPAPLDAALKNNLASMGVATTVNSAWMIGLDAIGLPLGSDANTWASVGGTFLTFAPAIESPMNPIYWPAAGKAFNSAIGIGMESGTLAPGVAGGAGVSGGFAQAAGAFGAILIGGALGGAVTDEVTGMNDKDNPQGQLASLALNRFESEAWGFRHVKSIPLFGDPLVNFMDGMIGFALPEVMREAENSIVMETRAWAGPGMDVLLISAIMQNSAKKGEAMDYEGFKKTLKSYYRQSSDAIYAQDNVLQTLRQNGLISNDQLGITAFVDNNGDITNPEGLKKYAADLLEERLKLRNEAIENFMKKNDLIVDDGGEIASKYGTPLTQEQLDAVRTMRATVGRGYMCLTNALATLRPQN